MKQKTPWNTLVGSIPGALPPVGGWLAATGNITGQTLAVFGILFFWQIPHFFSIAWLYKSDYKKAGFKMFMSDTNDQFRSNIIMVGFCILTLVFSLSLFSYPLGSMAMVGISEVGNGLRYGTVVERDGKVLSFNEKGISGPDWINNGHYIFSKEVFIGYKDAFSIEKDVFPKLAQNNELGAFKVKNDKFIDMGTPSSYEKLKRRIVKL